MKKITLKIGGMTCSACAANLENSLNKNSNINSNVNIATNTAVVSYNEDRISLEQIESIVKKAGFHIIKSNQINKESEIKVQRIKFIIALIFTLPLLYIAMAPMINIIKLPLIINPNSSPVAFVVVQFILTLPVIIVGYKFYTRGFYNLFKLQPNMDSLVAIGTSSAFIYSFYKMVVVLSGDHMAAHHLYFESTAVIITLILLGKYLELLNRGKTGKAIEKLMNLSPKKAIVIRNSKEYEISVDEIRVEDVILVRPGESFSVDGEIIKGETTIDESMLTGESIPIDKTVGDKVYGATVNKNGSVYYKALSVGADTTLSKIIKLVEEASGSKAPIAKLADKVSLFFVPIVIAIAIVASVIWAILGYSIEFVLSIFISVLVIACPCALGLATPTAIIIGTGKGANMGILFKNAQSLENARRITTAVFDKTGTITNGKPKLTNVYSLGNYNEKDLILYAASCEKQSEHPIATAILDYSNELNISLLDVDNFTSKTGFGIECVIGNKKIRIGKQDFFENVSYNSSQLELEGKTILYIEIDGNIEGVIAVWDTIKDTSIKAINLLNNDNIKTVMLTGDNEKTANAIGKLAGIKEIIANVLPSDKVNKVKSLQNKKEFVAMVGDGINDAPALATADIGIAIGNGTDIAIESSDIILISNNLESVHTAIKLSNATINNIKQNLFWAFFYNCIGIPIAAGAFYFFNGLLMDPMLAAGAMSLSSVSVVLNALRLNKFK